MVAWHNTLLGHQDRATVRLRMKNNAYFDNASTTWPKPEVVYSFIDQFQRSHGVNPSRGGYAMAFEAEAMVIQTRQLLKTFFGFSGPASRVVFTANVTDSINMALGGLLSAGDHVVVSRVEHNAVLRTVNHFERDRDLAVTRVPTNEQGEVDVDAFRAAIKTNTKALVINHASNVTGRIQALPDIANIAREHNIPLVVDCAQTAGVLPIDMQRDGIGILAFTGHKGMFGPMGVGGLLVDESIDLAVTKFGGNGLLSDAAFQPEAWPERHEVGTIALPAIAGLHAAQRWFNALGENLASPYGLTSAEDARTLSVAITQDDIETPLNLKKHPIRCLDAVRQIHRTEMGHLDRLVNGLLKFDHVEILGGTPDLSQNSHVSTVSFRSNKVPTQRIAEALDADHHVCVRAGLHCAPLVHEDLGSTAHGGAVRLAPGYFTDAEDIEQLLNGLHDVLDAISDI